MGRKEENWELNICKAPTGSHCTGSFDLSLMRTRWVRVIIHIGDEAEAEGTVSCVRGRGECGKYQGVNSFTWRLCLESNCGVSTPNLPLPVEAMWARGPGQLGTGIARERFSGWCCPGEAPTTHPGLRHRHERCTDFGSSIREVGLPELRTARIRGNLGNGSLSLTASSPGVTLTGTSPVWQRRWDHSAYFS